MASLRQQWNGLYRRHCTAQHKIFMLRCTNLTHLTSERNINTPPKHPTAAMTSSTPTSTATTPIITKETR
ncbi:hypothetical protein N7510_000403 [Penicillium lagena]|uniref:uncharacterized protein n=1 Tax=Penicillium lagena TaxID=94218 RepID=UPI0025411BB1|nr:uncharacterized protein N7510_000403 [Penicillium lagena]KAJ5624094.1 hypothetical protein N7510_000403 [Penicillium lagena]